MSVAGYSLDHPRRDAVLGGIAALIGVAPHLT
jgi:hypothetical protein